MTDADHRPEPAATTAPGAPHVAGAPSSESESGTDPLSAPLTYPGTPPWRPAVLVTGTAVLELRPQDDAPVGAWLLDLDASGDQHPGGAAPAVSRREMSLDQYLQEAGCPSVTALTPVLAVGSNASPAQTRRKLTQAGLSTLVPITAVTVRGLAVGVSAHVSRPGYLPATPVPDPDAVASLWVVWLNPAALAAIDATEPNYDRVRLPAQCPVQLTTGQLTTGQPVSGCWVYRSRHGYLVNQAGEPRRLTDQPTLITALLVQMPALAGLAGSTPREWIERTRDAATRDAIRAAFVSAGLVGRPTGL